MSKEEKRRQRVPVNVYHGLNFSPHSVVALEPNVKLPKHSTTLDFDRWFKPSGKLVGIKDIKGVPGLKGNVTVPLYVPRQPLKRVRLSRPERPTTKAAPKTKTTAKTKAKPLSESRRYLANILGIKEGVTDG